MMKRTVSLKLSVSKEHSDALLRTQCAFSQACNHIVPTAIAERCISRNKLHHLVYYPVRESSPLGSQMVCNAIAKVSWALTAQKKRDGQVNPKTRFSDNASVHYDVRTFSFLKEGRLSLYTVEGRAKVDVIAGPFQHDYLAKGVIKEAELIRRKGIWYFNLVLDMPPVERSTGNDAMGVDVGENVIAACSTGLLIDGGKFRHDRDKDLALRRRLQRNGTQSAKQLLRKVSRREQRHVTKVNHEVSKRIVAEAVRVGASLMAMEDLTHIRDRIKAGKRVRARLHRWAWRQLQTFVEYKGEGVGIPSAYGDPAYTSQDCCECGARGQRIKHRFRCLACKATRHADVNAALNHRGLALAIASATGVCNASECTSCF